MAQVIACHFWDETKDTAVPSLLALYLSWNIHLGGSQPLCHEYTMERLQAKELRPSANSHVSESGSSFSSQIRTSDDYTLAEISTAVLWETQSQDNPAKLLPDYCQIGLYIYKLNIWDYKYVYTHILYTLLHICTYIHVAHPLDNYLYINRITLYVLSKDLFRSLSSLRDVQMNKGKSY